MEKVAATVVSSMAAGSPWQEGVGFRKRARRPKALVGELKASSGSASI